MSGPARQWHAFGDAPAIALVLVSALHAACGGRSGWQEVVPRERWDRPARVWRWHDALIQPREIVAAGDATLWLAGRGGVLASSDGGRTWRSVMRGYSGFASLSASADGQRLCLLDFDRGDEALVCTADGAKSWWHPPVGRARLVAGTADGQKLWAATQVTTNYPLTFAIWHSSDAGRNWSEEWRGSLLGDLHVSDDGSLVVYVGGSGLIVRRDPASGRWTQDAQSAFGEPVRIKSTLTGSPDGESLWAAVVRSDSTVHVARLANRATRVEWCPAPLAGFEPDYQRLQLRSGADGRPVFLLRWQPATIEARGRPLPLHSADGCTWTPLPGVASAASDMAIGRGGRRWALVDHFSGVAVHRSVDGGHEWAQTWMEPRGEAAHAAVVAFDDGRAIALNGPAVAEGSSPSGWRMSYLDVPGTMSALAAAPDRSVVWAVGDGAVAESRAAGEWTVRQIPADQCPYPCALLDVFAADDGERVWAASRNGYLLHSSDAGRTWTGTRVATGNRPLTFRAVHGSPDGRTVVAIAVEGFAVRFAGRVWQAPVAVGGERELRGLRDVFVASDGRTAWAAKESMSASDAGDAPLLRSTDGGSTWALHTAAASLGGLSSISGTVDGRELWVAGAKGLFASADAGSSWHRESFRPRSRTRSTPGSWADFEESPVVRFAVASRGGGTRWAAATMVERPDIALQAEAAGTRPQILEARLVGDGAGRSRLELRLAALADGTPPPAFEVFGGGAQALAANRLLPVKDVVFAPPARGGDVWTTPIDPVSSLGVPPAETIHLRVELVEHDGVRQVFPLPPFVHVPWYEPYRQPALIVLGTAAALGSIGGVLLLLYPLALIRLAHPAALVVDAVPLPALAAPLKALTTVLVLPALAQHPRALDAWVRRHRPAVGQAFEAIPAARAAATFVALPLRIGDASTGELIERPAPDLVARCFGRERGLVAIVGPGGAGKTTLALQIARWAMEDRGRGTHPMLAVFVDEDTADLADVVRRKLRAMIDTSIPAWLCDALVRKGRILVVFDRVSEREIDTQRHVAQVHGSVAIGALLVTSRMPFAFEAGAPLTLHPQPLGSATLLHFMTSLLTSGGHGEVFGDLQAQIDLGHRLSLLVSRGTAGAIPMTPLLVRLFVERAVALAREGRSLGELPASIPDAYFDYLREVNPADPRVAHYMPHEQMLRAAAAIACVSLRVDDEAPAFVPREFSLTAALTGLAAAGAASHGEAAIRRLVDNGVLLERRSGPEPAYRFALDPLAEFLAAYRVAERCGADAACWIDLARRLAAAPEGEGFLLALRITCEAYGPVRGWACVSLPGGAGAPASSVL